LDVSSLGSFKFRTLKCEFRLVNKKILFTLSCLLTFGACFTDASALTEWEFKQICKAIENFGAHRTRDLSRGLSFLTGAQRRKLFQYLILPKFGLNTTLPEGQLQRTSETKVNLNSELSTACLDLMQAAAKGLGTQQQDTPKTIQAVAINKATTQITITGSDKFNVIIDFSNQRADVKYLGGSTAQAPEPGTPPGAEGPLGRVATVLTRTLVSYGTR